MADMTLLVEWYAKSYPSGLDPILKAYVEDAYAAGAAAMRERCAEESLSAVENIVEDLSDRRGLRQGWEQIDDEIQSEIKQVWAGIIADAIRKMEV
jgi:hypothetical protein